MAHFNAILIGGPPHSGKSVLTHSLTLALRRQKLDHYVLRACPDGEGDWSNEAPPETVRVIRQKGQFTARFVGQVVSDLNRRHLPLLVDVGGKPQPDQEAIFAQCTHAILIAQDEAGLAAWRPLVERNGLSIIAELLSVRNGEDRLIARGPLLRAHLTGLERGCQLRGAVFEAVVACAATYLHEPPATLRLHHLDSAPVDLAVDLGAVARQLGIEGDPPFWTPPKLPELLAYLPAGSSIGLYDRGPNWLFAAAAIQAQSSAFAQFDVRLGWVTPPRLLLGDPAAGPLLFSVLPCEGYQLLSMAIPGNYLDYEEAAAIRAPLVDRQQGLVLNGKMPHWLITSMAIAYCEWPWLAVYQPNLLQHTGNRAVVVASRTPGVAIGDLITMEEADLAAAQAELAAAC